MRRKTARRQTERKIERQMNRNEKNVKKRQKLDVENNGEEKDRWEEMGNRVGKKKKEKED